MGSSRLASTLAGTLIAVALVATAAAQEARIPIVEHRLANGMTILLIERHSSPTVAAGWVARAGSAEEGPGSTGIAHLLEHLMFKGTRVIGTRSWSREARVIEQLDQVHAEIRQLTAASRRARRRGEVPGGGLDPSDRSSRLAELRAEAQRLLETERSLMIDEEYDRIYTSNGAPTPNAFTGHDLAAYFVTLPANALELWYWMESDRLLHPVFREFYAERDVVLAERRLLVESDPVARQLEQFDAVFWTSLPYDHPLTGWPSDLEALTRDHARRFFATHYAPHAITAVLVGDFDPDRAMELARRYFGRLSSGAAGAAAVDAEEIEQIGQRRLRAEADCEPEVVVRWHTVPFMHRDVYVLDVISDLLDGSNGRLHRALVEEQGVAVGEPYAVHQPMRLAGMLELGAAAAEDGGLQRVEAALLAEVERLASEPVPDCELRRVTNRALTDRLRRLRSNTGLLREIMIAAAMGDWSAVNESATRLPAVTAEDVRRVAGEYLGEGRSSVLWLERRPAAEGSE